MKARFIKRLLALIPLAALLLWSNSQFIVSTHSTILMAYPNAQIFSINDNGVNEVEYEQTEHFKTTK
jgi:predicted ATPase